MSEQKLKNAPLKEVIFKLLWDGSAQQNDIPQDVGYENAIGKLQERLESIAPIQKRLYPISVPIEVFGVPVFQYWKGELKWPVIQHGPGILSVNDTDANYVWADTYKPLILTALDALIGSYGKPLSFNTVSLKYIDAIDVVDGDLHGFVTENLRITTDYKYDLPGRKTAFNLTQWFDLADGSVMQLQVNSGINNKSGSPAVVWTTSIEKKGKLSKNEIIEWLEVAHDQSSQFFKTMLNPSFYAKLDE